MPPLPTAGEAWHFTGMSILSRPTREQREADRLQRNQTGQTDNAGPQEQTRSMTPRLDAFARANPRTNAEIDRSGDAGAGRQRMQQQKDNLQARQDLFGQMAKADPAQRESFKGQAAALGVNAKGWVNAINRLDMKPIAPAAPAAPTAPPRNANGLTQATTDTINRVRAEQSTQSRFVKRGSPQPMTGRGVNPYEVAAPAPTAQAVPPAQPAPPAAPITPWQQATSPIAPPAPLATPNAPGVARPTWQQATGYGATPGQPAPAPAPATTPAPAPKPAGVSRQQAKQNVVEAKQKGNIPSYRDRYAAEVTTSADIGKAVSGAWNSAAGTARKAVNSARNTSNRTNAWADRVRQRINS